VKCEFVGCKREAKWACRKLWDVVGRAGNTLHTCDEHKPDPDKRSEKLKHLPFFYDVQPIWACPSCGRTECDGYCSVDRFDGHESDRGIR
jgi:hypothetical protein